MLWRVTFTGIDERTDVRKLCELYEQYPFVEFGFLTSDREKGGRFPQKTMLDAYREAGLHMALHVCGRLAYDLVHTGDWSEIYRHMDGYMSLFDRIQLNIPKSRHFAREICFPSDKMVILQLHEGTEELFACYRDVPTVVGFQDASGGRGIREHVWMPPQTVSFGYAGGIGTETVVEAVSEMEKVCPTEYWIDMESGVRTEGWFDVEKCRSVCRALCQSGLICG